MSEDARTSNDSHTAAPPHASSSGARTRAAGVGAAHAIVPAPPGSRRKHGDIVRVVQFHTGRLLDHVHLRVADLASSRRFYVAVLAALGRELTYDAEHAFAADELFVSADGEPTTALHLAFQAADRETVVRFHEAALGVGGRDNGGPGERTYHPGYYAAYVLDPDGNNVEVVFHGPARRSAPSVVIEPE